MNMRNMIETEQKTAVKLYKEMKKNQRVLNKKWTFCNESMRLFIRNKYILSVTVKS